MDSPTVQNNRHPPPAPDAQPVPVVQTDGNAVARGDPVALWWAWWSVFILSGVSGLAVAIGLWSRASFGEDWWLQLAVFAAVAVIPHWIVDGISIWAEAAGCARYVGSG